LNELPGDFMVRFDALWKEQIASVWIEQHAQDQRASLRLQELEFASHARKLTLEELWERASLISSTQDAATAMPLFKDILEQNPDHAEANLAVGTTLLEQHDATGISYLEKAMKLSEATTGEACRLAYEFHLERGEFPEADKYYERLERFSEKMQTFYDHAIHFSGNDRFEGHGLSESEVEKLRTQLDGIHGLGRTYLVRKIVDEATEPLYVIGVFATYTWRAGENEKHVEALLDELSSRVQFPHSLIFISMDAHRYLLTKFEGIPGAVVLEGGEENVEHRH
jgi:tetratricopeptide (TPR) repeat protein